MAQEPVVVNVYDMVSHSFSMNIIQQYLTAIIQQYFSIGYFGDLALNHDILVQ